MTKTFVTVGENDLFTTHPHLISAWSTQNEIDPQTVGAWSSKKAWWTCTEGEPHEYLTNICYRAQGRKCSYCSGSQVLAGFNDLVTTHPGIAAEVSPRSDLGATNVSSGSTKMLLWLCPEQHEYLATPAARVRGRGCPYCAGKKVLVGYNDVATTRPDIAAEWAEENSLCPTEVTVGSQKVITWQCPQDDLHVYSMPVYKRKERGCPYCAGKRVAPGQSLFDKHPALEREFAATNTIQPHTVTEGSSRKLEWVCAQGHTWTQSAKNRVKGYKCPVCTNKKLLPGVNDFATQQSQGVMSEWDYDKNGIAPDSFILGKGKKSWWKCPQGHSYKAENDNRVRGSQCPRCAKHVSRMETEVSDYLKHLLGEDAVKTSDRSLISPYELDMVVPGMRIAVEFNGVYWHTEDYGKSKWYHYDKWKRCQEQGYQLIQIWEDTWMQHPEAVKAMLAAKVGADTRERVFARKTTVVTVTTQEAQDFLNFHHIQGWTRASTYLGLRDQTGTLVAVCAFKKVKDVVVLERYATSAHVVGGQSKLLAAYDREHEYAQMVTFADREVSDGGLYEATGWRSDGILNPDYRYAVKGTRVHKFNYRLARFKADTELEFKEGLSERELAALNHLPRVWDSGKVRYVRSPSAEGKG